MKKIFRIFFLITCFMTCASLVYAQNQPSFEDKILQATLLSCIAPTALGADDVDTAQKLKLIELPADKARLFDKTGGKVFAFPALSFVVLATGMPYGCMIFARQVVPDNFWASVDKNFDDKTPFKLVEKKTLPDGLYRSYEAYFNGRKLVVFISVRDKFVETASQVLITISSVSK